MDQFTEGALFALATMCRLRNNVSECAEALCAMDVGRVDCSGMLNHEKEMLRVINGSLPEEKQLRGLESKEGK